jgi:phthalate 4,5-dioxygenase oxygenase subunit
MLTKQDNDRLCRTGPETPMGKLFRRYWMPICTADRLSVPGGAPRAERLLGQNFVVFRTKEGVVGVLDEFCLHRGASLAIGRVEDCGIRCLYHGWKFGTEGTVLDIMNVPAGKRPPKLKANAYPAAEAGGIIWVYLGPADKVPPVPNFEYMRLPDDHVVVMRVDGNFNWVQATEAGLDSSHVGILHTNVARPGWTGKSDESLDIWDDTGPTFELEETEFGYHYAAFRQSNTGGAANCRIVPFIMPSGRIIPGGAVQGAGNATLALEIPIDDENTATYTVRYSNVPITPWSRLSETGFDDPRFYDPETQKLLYRRGDTHLQRRDAMDENWTGFRGIAVEDAVINASMGPIYDRSTEHLIASDIAVVSFRRRLFDSVDRMEAGGDPVGSALDMSLVSSIDAPAPDGHWRDLIPSHRVPDMAPAG